MADGVPRKRLLIQLQKCSSIHCQSVLHTLHTSPFAKNPKHITCTGVLRVVLGVFCVLSRHYWGIEFKTTSLRAWRTKGSKTLTWLWTLLSAAWSYSSQRELSMCSFLVKSHAVWRKYQISSAQNLNQGFYRVIQHTNICTFSFLTEGFSLESLTDIPAL